MFEKIIEYFQMWNIQIGISKIIFISLKTFRFLRKAYFTVFSENVFKIFQ